MSTETAPAQQSETAERRPTVEDRVERIATYWGRAVVDAWRTVFPRREGTR